MTMIGRRAAMLGAAAAPVVRTRAPAATRLIAKVAATQTAEYPSIKLYYKLADLVKERTNGALELRIFPNGQLGGDVEALGGIKLGSIEAANMPTSVFTQYVPELAIADLPFVFRDREHSQKACATIQRLLGPKLVDAGFYPIAGFCTGARDLMSTSPVASMPDLQGKKVRVIQSPTIVRTWQLLGANPSPIPAPEVYLGLQTHVIDGCDGPATNYLTFKWYEVARHFTKLSYVNTLCFLTFSNSWIQKVPKDQLEILQKTTEEIMPEMYAACVRDDETDLTKTVQAGCTVHALTDRDAWVKATSPIIEDFAGKTPGGQKLVDDIRAI